MSKQCVVFVCVALSLFAADASADGSSAEMHVSVNVVARTVFTIDEQPSSIEVTNADLARGYVEVKDRVKFRLHTNARAGYAIQFAPLRGPFARAEVRFGTTIASVSGNDGSWVIRPYQPGVQSGTLAVRLMLPPGLAPGSYDWPLTMDATSL